MRHRLGYAASAAMLTILVACGSAGTATPTTTTTPPTTTVAATTTTTPPSTTTAPTTVLPTTLPAETTVAPTAPPVTPAPVPKKAPTPAPVKAKPRTVAPGGRYPLPPTRIPAGARAVLYSGRCDWLIPHLDGAGLPHTFLAISARESGCAPGGVHVSNRTDLSTSRFGLNFRGRMAGYWASLCGATSWLAPGASVTLDVRCAAAAFHRSGYSPWRA